MPRKALGDKPVDLRRRVYLDTWARTGDKKYACAQVGYERPPPVTARDQQELEARVMRFMLDEGVDLSVQAFRDALQPEVDIKVRITAANSLMARLDKQSERYGDPGAEGDLSTLSADTLARLGAQLEAQLNTIAGQAKDVTPSTDAIDDAEPITDIDPFG